MAGIYGPTNHLHALLLDVELDKAPVDGFVIVQRLWKKKEKKIEKIEKNEAMYQHSHHHHHHHQISHLRKRGDD